MIDRTRTLLTARYGADNALPNDVIQHGNEVIETLLSHTSIRHYETRPLEPGTLELLIAAAQSAATSSNLQTYSIIAVEDSARKQRLSVLAGKQKHIIDAPLFLLFCADLARLKALSEERGSSGDALEYTEMFVMSVVDAALAAQNLVVAAESLGLGTCYIGGMRNHPSQVAFELNLPDKVFGVFGLTVGYPRPAAENIKPRLAQAGGILHREQYNANYHPAVDQYEGAMKIFNDDHSGREGRGWIDACVGRVATADSLGAERSLLKELLAKIGLGMK